jgi:SOS-response transcriptional repressor LexA
VVDAKTAWEWTRSDAPYPVTRSTEMLWVTRKGISDRAFGLILLGDNSMADEFMVGDIAIIDPEEAPAPGDYVAARLDAEKAVVLRKYRLREVDATGLHHIDLIPINPDYPTITITSRDPKQILWPMLECRKFRLASGTRRRF